MNGYLFKATVYLGRQYIRHDIATYSVMMTALQSLGLESIQDSPSFIQCGGLSRTRSYPSRNSNIFRQDTTTTIQWLGRVRQ